MGRPALSVHCGGIPVMPNTNFEDRAKTHINSKVMDRKEVTVAGLSGFQCTWENMGKKHLGLFLEEKITSGMSVIHFVDCQAPSKNSISIKKSLDKF